MLKTRMIIPTTMNTDPTSIYLNGRFCDGFFHLTYSFSIVISSSVGKSFRR